MSTLRVGTFANAAGSQSTSAENVINGSAKAWVNFNGSGVVAIRAAYNVASITDIGVGNYIVNFATALPDANYCVLGTTTGLSSTRDDGQVSMPFGVTLTTTAVPVYASYGASASFDPVVMCVSVFR